MSLRWKYILFGLVLRIGFCTGQNPTCPGSYIYGATGSGFMFVFDASQAVSSSNPSISSISNYPGGSLRNLALLPNINGSPFSPTFYGMGGGTTSIFYYWNGINWISTGHQAPTVPTIGSSHGLGGCASRMYDVVVYPPSANTTSVFTYNGNSNSTLMTVLNHGLSIFDVVVDCNCNFYVLDNNIPQNLRMYDQNGNPVCTYSLTNPIPLVNVNTNPAGYTQGGLAIIGNTVYVANNTASSSIQWQNVVQLYAGVMNSGSISFSLVSNDFPRPSDLASCPTCNTNSITASASAGTINCFTPTAQITASVNTVLNPVTYSWSGPGIVGTSSNAAVSVTAVGNYTCLINAGGCWPTQPPTQTVITAAIGSNTLPTLASISPTGNICPLPSAQLFSFPNSSLYSTQWSGPGIVSGANSPTLNLNIGGVYTVVVTNTLNGCSDTLTQTVLQAPVLNLSPGSGSICVYNHNGSANSISLSASGAISYTFLSSPNLSLSASTGSSSIANAQAPFSATPAIGSVSLIGFDGVCSNTLLSDFTIVPNPVITVVPGTISICVGQSATLTASGASAYTWTPLNSLNNANSNPVIANPTLSTVYSVYGSSVSCLSSSENITLSVLPLPTITLLPNNPGVCLNTSSVILNASGTGTSFSWSPSQYLSANNSQTVLAYPQVNTSYLVIASLNGCTNSAQTTVNVVPPPSLTGQFNSPTLCSQAFNGSPNTITLSANGANTYSLVTIPDMFNANPGGPVSPLTSIPPYTGAGSATLSGSNGVCTVTLGLTFTVLPNPNISVNNYTPVICAGETFTYTNQGASTYTWSSATPGSTLYSNGGVAVASPTINSVFSVFGGSLGCNSALQTTTITVNPLPTLNVSPNPLLLCLGSTAELFAQSNGTSFVWLPPYGLNSYTSQQVSTHINQNQNYTVIATLNNCSNTAVAQVSILPLPSPQIVPVKDEVCLYETIHLKGEGGMYYVWTAPNLQTYTIQNLQLDISHMVLAGNYTLKVVDANACFNYSTHPVVVHDLPNGYLKPERIEFCVPYCNAFTFVPNTQSQITQAGPWSMNSLIYSGNTFTSCFSKAGEFSISGPIQDEFNCKNTVGLSVIGRPKPKAAFYVTPENPVEGLDEVSFVNVSSNVVDFSWQAGGIASIDPSFVGMTQSDWMSFNSDESSPSYLFQEVGIYGLMLMVKNEFNCWDTVMHTIKVESDFAAYIPNAFTPNGDGLNDTFYPVMRGVKKFELQIFDRWGELIFKSTETDQVWDGSFQGQECKQDVYNYKLVLLNVKGTEKVYSGSITLYR